MSETPSVLRYAMSPVSMLTATSSPHGVGPHSSFRSGSPKRRSAGERPGIDVAAVRPQDRGASAGTYCVVFEMNRCSLGSYDGPQKLMPPAGPGGEML